MKSQRSSSVIPWLAGICLAASTMVAEGEAISAQQSGNDEVQPSSQQTAPHRNEAHMPASGDFTTRESKVFNGRMVKENGSIVLKDPVSKITYKLNDTAKAKRFVGKQVKVSGKFDQSSNTIQVEKIEPGP